MGTQPKLNQFWKNNQKNIGLNVIGAAILAFGLYNVHSISSVTEGGALGLTLLLEHWYQLSPSITNMLITVIFYFLGWRVLGRQFLILSAVSVASFSFFYAIFERFSPIYPSIATQPLLASIVGALFVGVGVGFCVRGGGAPSGDDALAMTVRAKSQIPIQWVYLLSDAVVLLLSLTYIPWTQLIYSLITVFLSGQIIGWINR